MNTHKRHTIDNREDVTAAPKRRGYHIFSRLATAVLLLAVTGTITFQFFPGLILTRNKLASVQKPKITSDPSEAWEDNIWPIRPTTPWDISTDFPHPRTLEYDVTEGTWLRLDVHPKTGDIVFDMMGDLYCLPAKAYTETQFQSSPTKARPILLGIPHDSDPHFSPDGKRLVYRSDAELGVENIWITKWEGCEDMDIRPAHSTGRKDLMDALEMKEVDDDLLARNVKETSERKARRLIREGRLVAQRVTNETYRWVSDARFHPSGSKVIATKWYTSSRSLGAGEGWEYQLSNDAAAKVELGSGKRIVGRTLPTDWNADRYGDQQIGPEQFIWRGEDALIYAKNVVDDRSFAYSKDVHKGIYAIFSYNITRGSTETLVSRSPGGASRPELSRDGRTLAYVTRIRDKQALVLKDLESGTIHYAWYGLTYDLSGISAPMGTYPSFAFTPNDAAIIIWAAGQIYSVPLVLNSRLEKVGLEPKRIPFVAHVEKRLAETRKTQTDIHGMETKDTQRVHAFKELRVDDSGQRAVFRAAGVTYIQHIERAQTQAVPVKHHDETYYSPSFVHGEDDLVIHARWSDTNFTTFELANFIAGTAIELEGLPLGRYYSPVLCECPGNRRQIAFVKTGGNLITGDVVATSGAGLYIGQITIPSTWSQVSTKIPIRNLHFVPSDIDTEDSVINMRFFDTAKKLLVQQSDTTFYIDLGAAADGFGKHPHYTLATGRMSTEMAVSPSVRHCGSVEASAVAFVDFSHIYVTAGKNIKEEESVWSKPGNATKGLARLSLDGGHDIVWSRDGKKIFWLLGPYLHSLEISKLASCADAIKKDTSTFGISCVKGLLDYQEIIVEHSTDIKRLKQQSLDALVIVNATVLTMEGDPQGDLIPGGVLISRAGVVDKVGYMNDEMMTMIPQGATVINAQGGFVIPGFIDAHAHWDGYDTLYPAKSWEQETFLAHGVTTLHNPSADNVATYVERSMVESGKMIGPRIFHTGGVIYGAADTELHQDIIDMDEAHSALIRIKAEGGPASFSYKNYNLPSRASRQRLLLAARNLSMLCVPEGGMNLDWDLTYIIDGMTTIEHNLPVPVLYDDITTLFALSGTGNTPTHLVNYGGPHGEQFVWSTEDVPNNPKLRRFTRHDTLETLSESTYRPANSWALFNTSASVANMVRKGLKAHIGAHGEPPLGLNYHAEMHFTQLGGLSNYEVLQAATSSAAITLGLDKSIGTLTPGKLADFIIYAPGVDLLGGDIRGTRQIRFVARGGRIWDADTMIEVWPMKGRKQQNPPINAD